MVSPRLLIVTLAAVSLCATVMAVEPPQPVSPGSTEIIERIATPCPTFSWAQVPGAVAVRIAVYQVPDNEDTPSVLRFEKELPGSTSSWTPSLPDCLTPGTYAWGVGASTNEGGPFWSKGSWFQVVAVGTQLPGASEEPGRPPRDIAVAPAAGAAVPEEGSGVRGRVGTVAPQPARLLYTYFAAGANGAVKAGAVDAASFTGDGSGLTNLTAANIAAGTAGIDISGNAATATTISPLTPGGVLFGSATNTIGQDAAQFFWDNGLDRLGLGTSAPNEQLELTGNLRLPQTTSTPVGVLYLSGTRFMHAYHPTSGQKNTFLGYSAGNFTMGGSGLEGTGNTGVGYSALQGTITAYNNTALGAYALVADSAGVYNTAVGFSSLRNNTIAHSNTAVGTNSLYFNTTATANTAVGVSALQSQSFSNDDSIYDGQNTAVGYQTLMSNNPTSISNGTQNTAVGANSLNANTIGHSNTAIGTGSLRSNTIGTHNVAAGNHALFANTTASSNTAVGYQALTTQSYNPGYEWETANTAVGVSALEKNQPSLDNNGIHNTATGAYALQDNTDGTWNSATGYRALADNTTGNANTADGELSLEQNTTGWRNTAVGSSALKTNQTGSNNTAVGVDALGNVAVGQSGNVALGYQAGMNEATSGKLHIANNLASDLIWGDFSTSQVAIPGPPPAVWPVPGPGLYVNGTLGMGILPPGLNGSPVCWLAGVLGNCNVSDAQLKTDVVALPEEMDVLDTLSRLRGVAFTWDRSKEPMKNASERREIGMIAQEVEKVLPSLVARSSDGYRSLDYAKLTALLVEVAKAQQAEIEELRALVRALAEEH